MIYGSYSASMIWLYGRRDWNSIISCDCTEILTLGSPCIAKRRDLSSKHNFSNTLQWLSWCTLKQEWCHKVRWSEIKRQPSMVWFLRILVSHLVFGCISVDTTWYTKTKESTKTYGCISKMGPKISISIRPEAQRLHLGFVERMAIAGWLYWFEIATSWSGGGWMNTTVKTKMGGVVKWGGN